MLYEAEDNLWGAHATVHSGDNHNNLGEIADPSRHAQGEPMVNQRLQQRRREREDAGEVLGASLHVVLERPRNQGGTCSLKATANDPGG